MAEGAHDEERGQRLADDDDEGGGQHLQRMCDQDVGVEQHAHRDEEQHRKGVAQRQRIIGGLVAQFGLVEQHAGEESAQRERHAEQHGRTEGHAQRHGQDRQGEQFARTRARHCLERPRNHPSSDHQHHCHEQGHLEQGQANAGQHLACSDRLATCGNFTHDFGQHGHQHQGQYAGQVFHDQPAHRDPAAMRIQQAAFLHGP